MKPKPFSLLKNFTVPCMCALSFRAQPGVGLALHLTAPGARTSFMEDFAASAPAPCGRFGGRRVLGPVMFRVSAGHVLADLEPRSGPEPGQIRRHLHRPMRRR